MKSGIILFAHGSTVESANEAVYAVARDFVRAGGHTEVEVAFLDCARPDLADAVESLAGRGINDVLVLPYFLTLGIHLQRDLPRIINDLANIHQGMRIDVAPPLDGHPALVEILLDRARAAAAERKRSV